MKTGLFFGTFDPVHNAHIKAAKAALSAYGLDEICFIPSGMPVEHNKKHPGALPVHRYNMLKIAVCDEPKFSVSDIETKSKKPMYTVETILEYKSLNPDAELYILAGEDTAKKMPGWQGYDEIKQYAKIISFARMDDISSTIIRDEIKKNGYSHDISESVMNYITAYALYQENLSYEIIKKRLAAELDEHRYIHSIGVADTAKDMAEKLGGDPEKAYRAGLLHDVGKPYSGALRHAPFGRQIAEEYYNEKDADILNSIENHTLGRIGMSLLEKIIFVADFIEPGREFPDYPGLVDLRNMARVDIDNALLESYFAEFGYLARTGREIDARALEVYNYYRGQTHG